MARNKKQKEKKHGSPEYMNTYGDIVTLLLCFFVFLFASSTIDAEKFNAMTESFAVSPVNYGGKESVFDQYGNGIMNMASFQHTKNTDSIVSIDSKEMTKQAKAIDEVKQIKTDFEYYFEEQNISDKVELKIEDNSTVITFEEGVLFDKGQAILRPEAKLILGILADKLILYPENDIEIMGHTDNDPINTPQFPNNWYLSAARAIEVNLFFIEEKGFSPERILAEGRGEYDPIVPNDSVENKAKNRRVEIKIKSKEYSDL